MMIAVIAAMDLVFPTRFAVFYEASQRVRATFYGSGIALIVLSAFTLSPHLIIVLGMVFLSGLWVGSRMLDGKHPSMVDQYAFSVCLALVAGALSTQDAGYAICTRLVLTLAGALSAVLLVALLDALTKGRGDTDRSGESDAT